MNARRWAVRPSADADLPFLGGISRWSDIDERKFGVGNISLAEGPKFPGHSDTGHLSGLEVDIRPLRKDGKQLAVWHTDRQYDRDATKKLVDLFWASGMVKLIYFNDRLVSRTSPWKGHDNHLHVGLHL